MRLVCTVWALGAIVLMMLFSVIPADPKLTPDGELNMIVRNVGIGIIAALLAIAYREPK